MRVSCPVCPINYHFITQYTADQQQTTPPLFVIYHADVPCGVVACLVSRRHTTPRPLAVPKKNAHAIVQ